MPTSTMSTRGQTVIPKQVSEHLGLRPGDKIDFVVRDNGEVVIRPVTIDVRQLFGMLKRPGQRPVSIEEMNKGVKERFRKEYARP